MQGVQGIQGSTGIQGLTGTIGVQGILGVQGIQGLQGIQGTQAAQGIQGIQGPNLITISYFSTVLGNANTLNFTTGTTATVSGGAVTIQASGGGSGGISSPYNGTLIMSSSTQATSTSTGTLVVYGGVGIGGNLYVGGSAYVTGDVTSYSDISLKENVYTIGNALSKLLNLRGVTYNKIGESLKSIGVIAQEIEKILPEVVRVDDQTNLKSVAYGNIVGLLIEAVKEQQIQIDELRGIINGIQNSK